MARYGYMSVLVTNDHIYVGSTSEAAVDEVAWLFEHRPGGVASQAKASRSNYVTGVEDAYWFQVTHLKGDVGSVGWWLLGQLGERGWEPFAATPESTYEGKNYLMSIGKIHLRKVY